MKTTKTETQPKKSGQAKPMSPGKALKKAAKITLAAGAMMVLFSCQREKLQQNYGLVTITANQQSLPDLKTNIGAAGTYTVTWNITDNLAVFDANGENVNKLFSYDAGEGTQLGTFSGPISNWNQGQQKTFNAFYPYDATMPGKSYSSYEFFIPLDQIQDFTSADSKYAHLGANDFMAASSVAVTKSGVEQPGINFTFKHLMAILDVEVTNNAGAVSFSKILLNRVGQDFTNKASLDLSKTPGQDGFYNPIGAFNWNELSLTVSNTPSTAVGGKFTGSMIVAPVNLTGETDIYITASGVDYVITKSTGINLEAGKRYKAAITISSPDLTDIRDGKVYKTVNIGGQIWMAENLAFLPSVSPPVTRSLTDPYYYVYGYEESDVEGAAASSNYKTYGVLYNWPAAKEACPYGWHLPANTEWSVLADYLTNGGYGFEGIGMAIGKSMATTSGWTPSVMAGDVGNDQATNNSSGFNALPGGMFYGSFFSMGDQGEFWSVTENVVSDASYWELLSVSSELNVYAYDKDTGLSVRCIKD